MLEFNFKDWIFHSVAICRPELCKRDGMMKMGLATNTDGYLLKLVLFESAHSYDADLIYLATEIPMKSLVRVLTYFLFFWAKGRFKGKIAKAVHLQLLIKHDRKGV